MRNATQVTVSPGTTTDLQPAVLIWVEGPPGNRFELTSSSDDLTFEMDDAVDTSLGVAGVMDMTNAAYDTITELVAAINADTDGYWKAARVGALNADSVSTGITVAQTEVTVTGKIGFYIQWDNSESNNLSITAGMEVLNSTATNALIGQAHGDVPAGACLTHGTIKKYLPEPIVGYRAPACRERQIVLNSFKFTPTYTGTAAGTVYYIKEASQITGPTFTCQASTVETEIVFDELGGYPQGLVLPPGYHALIRMTGTDVSAVAGESVTFTYGDPE